MATQAPVSFNQDARFPGHIPVLDGLRGVAIITVVWHNVTAGTYTGSPINKFVNLFSNSGWVGVQLFFVLSGFLITGLLLDQKGSQHQFRNFFMRRMLRIFPLYYSVLIAVFVLAPLVGFMPNWLSGDYQHQVWYWTYLNNWAFAFGASGHGISHFWSLAVEEQFYLVWPICVFFLSRRGLVRVCFFLIASALVFRGALTWIAPEFAEKSAYTFTVARWDALAIGALAAVGVRNAFVWQRIVDFRAGWILLPLGYVLFFMFLYHNFGPVDAGIGVINQTVSAIIFGLWLLLSVRPVQASVGRWNQAFLLHPLLRIAGKYSYAIYVFHLPVNVVSKSMWSAYAQRIHELGPLVDETSRAIVVFAFSLVLAMISWRLIEQPFLKMKKFFQSPRPMAIGAF